MGVTHLWGGNIPLSTSGSLTLGKRIRTILFTMLVWSSDSTIVVIPLGARWLKNHLGSTAGTLP